MSERTTNIYIKYIMNDFRLIYTYRLIFEPKFTAKLQYFDEQSVRIYKIDNYILNILFKRVKKMLLNSKYTVNFISE